MKNDDLIAVINEDFNYLAHYGVPGQKWGVYGGHGRKYQNHAVYARGNPRYKNSKYMQAAKDRMNQKHYFTDTPHENETADTLKNIPVEDINDLKRLSGKENIKKVRSNINHPNDGTDKGRGYNCPNCALAFDMTERGYDVIARPKPYRSNVENVENFFINGKLTPVIPDDDPFDMMDSYNKWEQFNKLKDADESIKKKDVDNARKAYWDSINDAAVKAIDKTNKLILRQGDGARGIIVQGFMVSDDPRERTTAYHAFNYKVENGKIRFYDVEGRNPIHQNGHAGLDEDAIDPRELYIMRTDNLELSPNCTEGVYSNRGIKY